LTSPGLGQPDGDACGSGPGTARRAALRRARLYLCTADRPDLAEFITAVCRAGVDIVQLRDKELPDRALLERAVIAREAAHAAGALFVLNDRPDLAVAAGADGVHVGQADAPVDAACAVVGDERLVGLSTHSPAQLDAASGVDYVAVGPIHATPTKPGRPAVGLEPVRYAAAHADMPFFAIGGIDPGNVQEPIAAGARRVVVVRAIAEAPDPEAAARALRRALDAAWEEAPVGAS
jgi:thiamine-phosphate pyrophosphorylase